MMGLKILDKYLVRRFIPPFFVATAIALFVLVMQTLWLYIDDILGKGASLWVVLELLFFLSMSLVPMSMIIGVLLSSVMLYGSLAERFELLNMKTAGISMLRILQPVSFVCFGISVVAFVFYDSVIPYSNLKFRSRLYDLTRQKPTLHLEEKVFNDDFDDYFIYFEKKHRDGRNLENVLIYIRDKDKQREGYQFIKARRGEMFQSPDGAHFILKIYDGHMYGHPKNRQKGESFVDVCFKEWMHVFDMSEFELERTQEDLFKSHQMMKNTRELMRDIDSFYHRAVRMRRGVVKPLLDFSPDTLALRLKEHPPKKKESPFSQYRQLDSVDLDSVQSFIETFPQRKRLSIATMLKSEIQRRRDRLRHTKGLIEHTERKWVYHVFELHTKFSYALACLIFLFIGAPMGAIIRKGGFGYPILISVVFFVIFILTAIASKKLMKTGALHPVVAAWLPVMVLLPIGVVLTYSVSRDWRFEWLRRWIERVRVFFVKRKYASA